MTLYFRGWKLVIFKIERECEQHRRKDDRKFDVVIDEAQKTAVLQTIDIDSLRLKAMTMRANRAR